VKLRGPIVWIVIAAAAGLWWHLRRRGMSPASSAGLEEPPPVTIGQVGARIEQPEVLRDFADALRRRNIVEVGSGPGAEVVRYWNDGLVDYFNIQTGEVRVVTPSP
jgi:hypothetical protein